MHVFVIRTRYDVRTNACRHSNMYALSIAFECQLQLLLTMTYLIIMRVAIIRTRYEDEISRRQAKHIYSESHTGFIYKVMGGRFMCVPDFVVQR